MPLTMQRLKEVLTYDPCTGIWRWRALTSPQSKRCKIGAVAGHKNTTGHLQITIDKKYYMAHRLAWLYMTGEWPQNNIDHKNGKHADNRWVNLREATQSQNMANARKRRGTGTQLKGVKQGRNGSFVAQIRVRGKAIYLGAYSTEKAAHAVYIKAARKHFGEFARVD